MSDREILESIHACFERGDYIEGISLCFELATEDPKSAANVFAAYRPAIIELAIGWAGEVNSHDGVFLPADLSASDLPKSYEVLRDFEIEHAATISDQAEKLPQVREHVARVQEMDTSRDEIEIALRVWRKDQARRELCGTYDPEKLQMLENSAIDIAREGVRRQWKKNGRKLKDLSDKEESSLVIKAVKEHDWFLTEAKERDKRNPLLVKWLRQK